MSIHRRISAVLCPQCTRLAPLLVDISAASKPGNAHTDWWNATYGRIRSIQGLLPDSCELCCLLQQAFKDVNGFRSRDTKINISNYTLAKYKDLQHSACLFEVGVARLVLAPTLPMVKTEQGEDIHAFTGRFVLPLLNSCLVRGWLDRCEKHVDCQPDQSSKDFDFPFRLIDVQNSCVVNAPPDARYIALSYVWGGVEQIMLNKQTHHPLKRMGSLTVDGL